MERFQDLSTEEVGDLFHCAHRVAPVISRIFGGTSLTISVQVSVKYKCDLHDSTEDSLCRMDQMQGKQ